jgi:prepilin-type N-terminal cleavage/methylation domain-containing protein
MRKRGLTLVEVLVSVVILTAGLTMILKSFFAAAAAADTAQNRIQALSFLEERANDLRRAKLSGGKLDRQPLSGQARLNNREFTWQAALNPFSLDANHTQNLTEVNFQINWQEAGRAKNAGLSAYFEE